MDDAHALVLLRTLAARRDEAAWGNLLATIAPILMQVARSVERDEDAAGDAFIFICEGLVQNDYARLCRFDPNGPARFITWLRAVARNLAIDAQRRRTGRFRLPKAATTLSTLHQSVLRLRYRDGLSLTDTHASLQRQYPGVTLDAVLVADCGILQALSPQQLFATITSRRRTESLSDLPDERPDLEPASDSPNPEQHVLSLDQARRLSAAVRGLSPDDRLIVRLRFEQNLKLAQIATIAGLRDAAHAHRRIAAILERLRAGLP